MKLLTEFVDWLNSVKEIITEDKGHLDHPEDMIILGGSGGANQALSAIEATAKDPQKITIKWDGYPALIFGRDTQGRFSIMDKHMFNKKDGSGRAVYSPEDFARYDAARGVNRTDLHRIIDIVWSGLEAASKGPGYYWGDLLFSKPLEVAGDGLYHFRANPNGITYSVDPGSDIGKYLTGKNAGIVVHQYLAPGALSTDEATPLDGGVGKLKTNTDVAIVPARMPMVPKIEVNQALLSKAKASLGQYGGIVDAFLAGAPQAAAPFKTMFTTYINRRIVDRNLKGLVDGFYEYAAGKSMTDSMRRKLFGYSDANGKHVAGYLDGNKKAISALFKVWVDIYNLKMDVVKQLNRAAKTAPVQGYLQDGTKTQEGFVSHGLKFVDRMGFSAQNLAAKQQQVTEAEAPKNLLVIYPGGFHPFHLGHASVYKHLKDKFPGANVYVAATDSKTERPFGFEDKQFLASQSGVPADKFVQVKSPYQSKEITQNFDPQSTVLVFAVSEKDSDRFNYGKKKDGSPSYFQPYTDSDKESMAKHGYIYVVPKIDFSVGGQAIDSASKIRAMYGSGNDQLRKKIVSDLYPASKKKAEIKRILDTTLLGIQEADNPNYFGGSSQSAIPGTPADLMPGPDEEDIKKYHKEMADLKRFMGRK